MAAGATGRGPGRSIRRTLGSAYDSQYMDSRTFLGLESTHNRFRWKLPVTPGISTSGGFLFGGSGLAAAISAMEGTSGRECIWATAQYLSYARPGEVVDVDVRIAVEGHQVHPGEGGLPRRGPRDPDGERGAR
jgi:hypothetical protein